MKTNAEILKNLIGRSEYTVSGNIAAYLNRVANSSDFNIRKYETVKGKDVYLFKKEIIIHSWSLVDIDFEPLYDKIIKVIKTEELNYKFSLLTGDSK